MTRTYVYDANNRNDSKALNANKGKDNIDIEKWKPMPRKDNLGKPLTEK